MHVHKILDSLVRMRNMGCGLIQTWKQLRFCLQSIEDGMLDIEFSDTEHKSSGLGGKFNTQHPILNGLEAKSQLLQSLD